VVKKQKHQLLDEQLFRQEMAGVMPLRRKPTTDSKAPRRKGNKPGAEAFPEDSNTLCSSLVDSPDSVDSPDGSSHRKNGIQKRTMQKLKRGRFAVGAELDLHNMNMETARSVLSRFIADSQSKSLSSVRIIHGKGLRSEGGPKLKLMTQQILRDHPGVMAYTTCKPANGGDGAVDVLLKTS
jgi:DNA-nicking Smr family endonuclease